MGRARAVRAAVATVAAWGLALAALPAPAALGQVEVSRAEAGYRLVAADGGVFAFGADRFAGSAGGVRLASPAVGGAVTPAGDGYWLVAADGGVFSFGDARFRGSAGALALNAPVVGMAATPTGAGYWLVAADGGVFSFGDAPFLGSAAGFASRPRVAGMAATPSGLGYWLAATDGSVFSFGDAPFLGSAAGRTDGSPVVAIAAGRGGDGYLLATAAGGVVAFGAVEAAGSLAGRRLVAPVVGARLHPEGGYHLVAADGGVFAFGRAPFLGSMAGGRLAAPVVGLVAGESGGDGETLVPGTYVERSDNAGFVVVEGGKALQAGSAAATAPGPERLRMEVGWSPVDGRASARLHNTSGVPLDLPGGLRVTVHVSRGGTAWRDLVVADPSIGGLAPGASVSVVGPGAAVPDGDGTYAYEGETVVVLR